MINSQKKPCLTLRLREKEQNFLNEVDYHCVNCNKIFIPFKYKLPCPHCKTPADTHDYTGYIEHITDWFNWVNKPYGASGLDPTSYSKRMQRFIFSSFNYLENTKHCNGRDLLLNRLANTDIDTEYSKDNIRDILLDVYDVYLEYLQYSHGEYMRIQIPSTFKNWFGKRVSITYGPVSKSLQIFTEQDYLKILSSMDRLERTEASEGWTRIMLLTTTENKITKYGELRILKTSTKRLGHFGKIIFEEKDGRLIIRKTFNVFK